MHEKDDFPDAYNIHPRVRIENKKVTYWVRIKKKIISGLDTHHSRCSKYSFSACLEVYYQKFIEKHYKCDPTFLFNGSHLYKSNLEKCNESQTLEILEILRDFKNVSDCKIRQACLQTKYLMNVEKSISNNTRIGIMYEDPTVEHHIAHISYDLQSLLGEIGGTLGLTLGLSLSSISDLIISFYRRLQHILHKY